MAFIAQMLDGNFDSQSYLKRCNEFASGTYQSCPYCERDITHVHAIHFMMSIVMYSRPCNCRLGHWDGIPQWLFDMNKVTETTQDEPEPTAQELRDMGYEVPVTLDEWNGYCAQQEAAGQLILPLYFDKE